MDRLLIGGGANGPGVGLYNDEFDKGNRGFVFTGTTSPDIGTTTPGVLHMPSGSAAHRARIPPMPFTVVAFLSSIVMDDISSIYGNASLVIAEATPAGAPGPVFWGPEMPDVDALGTTALYDGRFANFGAEPTHLGTKIQASGHVYDVPRYQRIDVHSPTNMDILYSSDITTPPQSATWSTYGTGFNPTLTPGAIMFVSFGCQTEWSWLRFF